jgi:hypothetical protein
VRFGLALLSIGLSLWALEPIGAAAQGTLQSAPPRIWYRAGEGCPDRDAFLARLSARGVEARAAEAGDPIDFVVTLGVGAGGSAVGSVERQSSSGTVALRRLEDASCEAVADALALTLALAHEREAAPASSAPTAALQPPAPATTPGSTQPAQATAVPASAPAPAATPAPAASTSPDPEPSFRFGLAAGVTASLGLAPAVLPGGALQLSILPPTTFRSELRIGAFGGFGAGEVGARDYDLWLVGGALEACLPGGRAPISSCVGLGVADLIVKGQGAGGRASDLPWVAASALLRGSLALSRSVALEAQIGVVVPLTRYELFAGPELEAYESPVLGGTAGVGVSVALR